MSKRGVMLLDEPGFVGVYKAVDLPAGLQAEQPQHPAAPLPDRQQPHTVLPDREKDEGRNNELLAH